MNKKQKKLFFTIRRYIVFFLLMSFIVTCCMLVFLTLFQRAVSFEFTEKNIKTAAMLTFFNIIFLSLICTIIDGIRRKIMVDRPVKKIIKASKKIIQGDFSVRIKPINTLDEFDGFNEIINYFNRMAEELSGVETLRTDFISNVSHELKTPLAVMQNYGTMLQSPDLSEEQRIEYAKAISERSRSLADLITNILKLNRLENQNIYPEKKRFNLSEQLCECMLQFENIWEEKEIEIFTDIDEEIYVENDPELLSLVWNNLFSNALKFTDNGGKVSLFMAAENEFAIVTISDTGCGISSETGKHIFEKFYQGDTSHATKGNGLGLALVRRILDIIGGEISVESEIGKGSEFTVKIRREGNEKVY